MTLKFLLLQHFNFYPTLRKNNFDTLSVHCTVRLKEKTVSWAEKQNYTRQGKSGQSSTHGLRTKTAKQRSCAAAHTGKATVQQLTQARPLRPPDFGALKVKSSNTSNGGDRLQMWLQEGTEKEVY